MFDRWQAALVCVALATLILSNPVLGQGAERSAPESERRVEAGTLRTAITDSTDYLVSACGEDGKFVYRINLDPDIQHSDRYNILRHAGTIYSLAESYHRQPDPAVLDAMKRAVGFLRRVAIGPVPEQEGLLATWSKSEFNYTDNDDVAKLGGTGLTLVALLSLEQLVPGTTDLAELRALGRFVRYMQKDDGAFYSMHYELPRGRDDSWTSLYYPGEAALGMVMLYNHDKSDEWLESAVKAMSQLAISRKPVSNVPADHWALIATARLLALEDTGGVAIDRELLVAHGKKIVENIVRSQPTPAMQLLLGSHTPDGRTTPVATRLEGLVAALSFIPVEDTALRRRIMRSLETGIAFLLLAQVDDAPHRGAMPRSILRLDTGDKKSDAHFNRRAREVRIDYVQHALSAYIGYERLVFEPPRPPVKSDASARAEP